MSESSSINLIRQHEKAMREKKQNRFRLQNRLTLHSNPSGEDEEQGKPSPDFGHPVTASAESSKEDNQRRASTIDVQYVGGAIEIKNLNRQKVDEEEPKETKTTSFKNNLRIGSPLIIKKEDEESASGPIFSSPQTGTDNAQLSSAALYEQNTSYESPLLSHPKAEGFYKDIYGFLKCENLKVKDVQDSIRTSPFYLYSKNLISRNYRAYQEASGGNTQALVAYALKANHNFNLLKHLASLGAGAVAVSGNEIQTAMRAGCPPNKIVFNGNAKQAPEIRLAIEKGILINIDSEFDFLHIVEIAGSMKAQAKCLLRINPDVEFPKLEEDEEARSSQFGIEGSELGEFLELLKKHSSKIDLIGVHCQLGQIIRDTVFFQEVAAKMITYVDTLRENDFQISYLNMGGGLGLEYNRKQFDKVTKDVPSPRDLINSIKHLVLNKELKLILEPGRSIVGDSCVLVSKVLGIKKTSERNYLNIDGSISELMRAPLFNSYKHIELAEPCSGVTEVFDVIGPSCEAKDFQGKSRKFPTPTKGMCLVVHDTGAYCQSMSSMYNMRLTCAEYWVDDSKIEMIRKPLNLDAYLSTFDCTSEAVPHVNISATKERKSDRSRKKMRRGSIVSAHILGLNKGSNSIEEIEEDDDEYLSPERPNIVGSADGGGDIDKKMIKKRLNLSSKNISMENNKTSAEAKTRNFSENMGGSKVMQTEQAKSSCVMSSFFKKSVWNQDSAAKHDGSEINTNQIEHPNQDFSESSSDDEAILKQEQEKINQRDREEANKLKEEDNGPREESGFILSLPDKRQRQPQTSSFINRVPSRASLFNNVMSIQDDMSDSESSNQQQEVQQQINQNFKSPNVAFDTFCPSQVPDEEAISPEVRGFANPYTETKIVEEGDDDELEPFQNESAKKIQESHHYHTVQKSQGGGRFAGSSPQLRFMSHKKDGTQQFRIREMEHLDSDEEDSIALNQDGREVDFHQLAGGLAPGGAGGSGSKRQPAKSFNLLNLGERIDKDVLQLPNREESSDENSISPCPHMQLPSSHLKFPIKHPQSVERRKINYMKTEQAEPDCMSLKLPPTTQTKNCNPRLSGDFGQSSHLKKIQNSHNKPSSSISSKRENFRNKLKMSGSFSNYAAFNRFKGDRESSIGSRRSFVVKLDGNIDTDAVSLYQQEQFQNEFEKNYVVLEELGQGCSSVVKKCKLRKTNEVRAVKIIRSDDDEYIEISKREYKVLQLLDSESIVKMYDCIHDENKGTLYLIMDFIEGKTIEDFVSDYNNQYNQQELELQIRMIDKKASSPMSPVLPKRMSKFISEDVVHDIVKQLLLAANDMHKRGVCHRDLKPDNALMNPETKKIKLMDFNAAKQFFEVADDSNSDESSSSLDSMAPSPSQSPINTKIRFSVMGAGGEERHDLQQEFKSPLNRHKTMKKEKVKFKMRTVTGLDAWSAPETRQGGEYTEAIDVYGIGCIMYYIIAQHPPFVESDEIKLHTKVQQGAYIPFTSECLNFYSSECIDLVRSMLQANPKARFTISQALESNWVWRGFSSFKTQYNSPKKIEKPDSRPPALTHTSISRLASDQDKASSIASPGLRNRSATKLEGLNQPAAGMKRKSMFYQQSEDLKENFVKQLLSEKNSEQTDEQQDESRIPLRQRDRAIGRTSKVESSQDVTPKGSGKGQATPATQKIKRKLQAHQEIETANNQKLFKQPTMTKNVVQDYFRVEPTGNCSQKMPNRMIDVTGANFKLLVNQADASSRDSARRKDRSEEINNDGLIHLRKVKTGVPAQKSETESNSWSSLSNKGDIHPRLLKKSSALNPSSSKNPRMKLKFPNIESPGSFNVKSSNLIGELGDPKAQKEEEYLRKLTRGKEYNKSNSKKKRSSPLKGEDT